MVVLVARFAGPVHCFFMGKYELPRWSNVAVVTAAVGAVLIGAVAFAKAECIFGVSNSLSVHVPNHKVGRLHHG